MDLYRFVVVAVGAMLFAQPAAPCTVIQLDENTVVPFFEYATTVHLGTVRATFQDDKQRTWVMDIEDTIKGRPETEVKISLQRLRGFIEEFCEPLKMPVAGDSVAAFYQDNSWMRPFELTPAVADKLRALGRSGQSNSTVERDGRKSGARPSP